MNLKGTCYLYRLLTYCIWIEGIKVWRMPTFSIPMLSFPIVLFLLFFFLFAKTEADVRGALVAYGTYAAMSTGLFSFGISIALERFAGYDRMLHISPLNPFVYFSAKTVMTLVFTTIGTGGVMLVASLLVDLGIPARSWFLLELCFLAGAIPSLALGLWLGYMGRPEVVASIANIVFLAMAFFSGLFVPLSTFHESVRSLAWLLPPFHVAALGRQVLGLENVRLVWLHLSILLVYSVIFFLCAAWAYGRDSNR